MRSARVVDRPLPPVTAGGGGKPGASPKSQNAAKTNRNNVTDKSPEEPRRGNTNTYALRKLRKDRPDGSEFLYRMWITLIKRLLTPSARPGFRILMHIPAEIYWGLQQHCYGVSENAAYRKLTAVWCYKQARGAGGSRSNRCPAAGDTEHCFTSHTEVAQNLHSSTPMGMYSNYRIGSH